MKLEDIKKLLLVSCDNVIANEPILTKVDGIIGDGDHGISMKEGFIDLKKYINASTDKNVFSFLKNCGITLIKSMGGASGVIFGTLFIGGLDAIKDDNNIDIETFTKFLELSAEKIKKRGRVKCGDRTMLDALSYAIDEVKNNKINDTREFLYSLYTGAEKGKEATKDMSPRIGRSKNFRDKAKGLPDPGAMSLTYIFEGLYKGLEI